MKIDLRALSRALIIWGLILTPLFSIGEVSALLRGSVGSQLLARTPLAIKAMKDVLLIALVALGAVRIARSGETNVLAVPFTILFLYTIVVAVLASDSPALALAGLRWSMPVFVAFFVWDVVDGMLMSRIASVLSVMLGLHVAMQIAELFLMSHWYGASILGLAARVPGFFLIPSTAGFFAVTALFFSHFYCENAILRRVTYFLAPVSVFLTQSGTGIVVLALVAALLTLGAQRAWLILPIGVAAVAILFPLLPLLTGRGADFVAVSGGTRVSIFVDLLRHTQVIPTDFGYVTNTAVSLVANGGSGLRTDAIPAIVDSTYASVWGNLGIGGGLFFALFCVSWGVVVVCSRRLDLYVATAIFALYSATTIIFEAYPMNLLLAISAAYFLREAYVPFWMGRTGGRSLGKGREARNGSAPAGLIGELGRLE